MTHSGLEHSFVIQGAIDRRVYADTFVTLEAVKSIRTYYPDAEIILSTWESETIEPSLLASCDQVVLSKDPGGIPTKQGTLNVNRQIVSTRRGLSVATREFSIKLRSDNIVSSPKLLEAFHCGAEDLILVTNLTSVDPRLRPRFFSLCDWVYAARTCLLQRVFDIEEYPGELLPIASKHPGISSINAEQWITLGILENLTGQELRELVERDEVSIDLHEHLLSRFFYIASYFRLGLVNTKYSRFFFGLNNMYTQQSADKYIHQCHANPSFDVERIIALIGASTTLRAAYKSLAKWF